MIYDPAAYIHCKASIIGHLEALSAEAYELTLVPRRKRLRRRRARIFTAEEILLRTGKLMRRNQQGYDVFIAPVDPDFYYILIDDIKDSEIIESYRPVYILQTSEHSKQGVFKIPRAEFSEAAACALCRELNCKYGDEKVSGAKHAFRLDGFQNKKPTRDNFESIFQYLYYWKHKTPDPAPELIEWGKELERKLESEKKQAAERAAERAPQRENDSFSHSQQPPAADVDAALSEALTLVAAHCGGDRSREDYNAICMLVRLGYSRDSLVTALHARSGRKAQPLDYAQRTVDKVLASYKSYEAKNGTR